MRVFFLTLLFRLITAEATGDPAGRLRHLGFTTVLNGGRTHDASRSFCSLGGYELGQQDRTSPMAPI